MALSTVLGYSFLGILGFIAASALTEVASPHVVAIWTVISGGVLQVIDAIVEGWLADLCATYQTYFRTSSRHLTRLGVPVRVLVKCLLAPLLIGAVLAAGAEGLTQRYSPVLHVESYQEPRDYLEGEAHYQKTSPPVSKKLIWGYAIAACGAVAMAWFQQAFWEDPDTLDQKPVTLGLLLVPVFLGWTVYATLDPWTLETLSSFKTSRGWFYHRDDLFAVAALAYHGWLCTRGSSGPLTARGLETGYGAAKVVLAFHLIAMGIAAIPAEHWPL